MATHERGKIPPVRIIIQHPDKKDQSLTIYIKAKTLALELGHRHDKVDEITISGKLEEEEDANT